MEKKKYIVHVSAQHSTDKKEEFMSIIWVQINAHWLLKYACYMPKISN